MSKFSKLYALATKATNRAASLTHKSEGEGSVSLKFDGFPASLSADGFADLAKRTGARVVVTAVVGESTGRAGGQLAPSTAAQMVREMTADTSADPIPEPVRKRGAGLAPSENGAPADGAAKS